MRKAALPKNKPKEPQKFHKLKYLLQSSSEFHNWLNLDTKGVTEILPSCMA